MSSGRMRERFFFFFFFLRKCVFSQWWLCFHNFFFQNFAKWVTKKKWKKEGKSKNEMKPTLTGYLMWARYHIPPNSDDSLGCDQALLSTSHPGSKPWIPVSPTVYFSKIWIPFHMGVRLCCEIQFIELRWRPSSVNSHMTLDKFLNLSGFTFQRY